MSGYLSSLLGGLRQLQGGGRGKILVAIAAGWGVTIGARAIYPVILPQLRESYELTHTGAGVLLTILFAAYAIGQLPGGVLADRIGERKTLTISLVLSAAALGLVVVSRSAFVLFALTGVFGFGVGFYAIARFTAIATIYPDRYGTAIGISNSAPEVGQAVFPPIAGLLAVAIGWEFGLGFSIPVFLVIAAALWMTLPKRPPEKRSAVDTITLETGRYVFSQLRNPPVVLATLVLVLGVFVWQAFVGFYPTYLIEAKGISPTVASLLFGLYFAATAFVHPISGLIYDRWDVRYTFAIVAISVPALAGLTLVDSVWALAILSVVLGTLLAYETSTESYLVNALPSDVEGTGFGILRTLVFAIGSVSPILFGIAADLDRFDEMFILLAILTLATVILAAFLPVVGRSAPETAA